MIHVSEITALTGYVRGGCSPIGMKKQFRTVLHETALDYDTIIVSGGKIGSQVELAPDDLLKLLPRHDGGFDRKRIRGYMNAG